MTLILQLDLDMVKMYLHTKNEVSMSSSSKVIAWTDRNTDRQTHRQTHRQTDMTENITYTRVVKSLVTMNTCLTVSFFHIFPLDTVHILNKYSNSNKNRALFRNDDVKGMNPVIPCIVTCVSVWGGFLWFISVLETYQILGRQDRNWYLLLLTFSSRYRGTNTGIWIQAL